MEASLSGKKAKKNRHSKNENEIRPSEKLIFIHPDRFKTKT